MKAILAVSLFAALIALVIYLLRSASMPPVLRSVLAVIFGFFATTITVTLCTLIATQALHLHAGQPTSTYLGLHIAYSLAAALLGGWVAGDLAPSRAVLHGAALAALLIVLALPGLLHPAAGQAGQSMGYLAIVGLLLPLGAIAGSALAGRPHRISS